MRSKRIKVLETLMKIPSPSGFENDIAKYIQTELLQYLPKTKIKIDFHNNVIATIKGTTNQTVMIDSHLDQIGFIVANVDRYGLISLQKIGGVDNQIISARHLEILTNRGKINAVVNRLHAHLIEDEDDEKVDSIYTAQVDIGVRGRKKVSSHVKIGDPVIFRPSFYMLRDDKQTGQYYAGYGFDDKIGCFILLETIKEIIKTKKKPVPNLIFTFSSQEEIGCRGAKELANRYKPDLFIEVDVTFATDYGEEYLEREAGRCELSHGIVLYRGVNIHQESIKYMRSIARNNKIKIQYQANSGDIGYSSDVVAKENGGIRALTIGVPLRNTHQPVEIINTKDVNYGINLLKCFLLHKSLGNIIEQ
jgi:endoglucanase